MFKRILIGVDGSEQSLRAAQVAGDLARAVRAERLRIVVAFDPIPTYLGQPNLDLAIHARLEQAEAMLRQALAVVGEVPSEIHRELIEGSPAEAILRVAETWDSNLIVMGSRGHSAITGLLLGSNSQKVLSHAPCPVLIVR